MPYHTRYSLRIAVIIFAICGWQQLAYAEYILSTTPRFSASELIERFGPLVQFLTEQLHSQVKIELAKSFQEYENNLQSGRFDIAFSNPTHYSHVTNQEVVAMEAKSSGPRMRGIIIVRNDSLISSVQNLIGRSVAIVSSQSTGGFLSQKIFLKERGIDVQSQLKIKEAHDNKQENVILAVYYGDVAAGFINEDALHIVDKYVPPAQIRVLERTAWLPNWAFSVKSSLPNIVKDRVRRAILSLKPGDPILTAMQIKEFVPATNSDYDVVRDALDLLTPTPLPAGTTIKQGPTASQPATAPPAVILAPVAAAQSTPAVTQHTEQVTDKPRATQKSTKKSRKAKVSKQP